ncbi:LANO_0H05930g1_1 [Lachancea nothofagi CBS 11611]|uniref:LANO_0H05930g1_1 n=1 Tax=Lachancea nothofagi CBS 11611 TaxID=1266666 RepID=A0A1G4KLR6_9SACH|nr:LANO_0H05930g1_1 [Lachancea nothofagi CBS 11611]
MKPPAPLNDERFVAKKHQKFLERHLHILPSKFQDNEPNKLAIVSYALLGLSILGVDISKKYKGSTEYLKKHYQEVENEIGYVAGFVPSISTHVKGVPSLSLTSTLFGIWSLACLVNADRLFEIIDREKVCQFVAQCQVSDNGLFVSSFDVTPPKPLHYSSIDPTDLRHTYVAIAILYLMGCRTSTDFSRYISLDGVLEFIKQQACPQGGFGQYFEPHAGFTSCALSILKLINDRWDILPSSFYEVTFQWLLQRQISSDGPMTLMTNNEGFDPEDHGGFQGRENKFADTCYGFWCLNSLEILGPQTSARFEGHDFLVDYLLNNTQNKLLGGFAKNDEDDPDLYHTFLGLAALATISGDFDGTTFLPQNISRAMKLNRL